MFAVPASVASLGHESDRTCHLRKRTSCPSGCERDTADLDSQKRLEHGVSWRPEREGREETDAGEQTAAGVTREAGQGVPSSSRHNKHGTKEFGKMSLVARLALEGAIIGN